MGAELSTENGVYSGRTVASIIRRVFGRDAYVRQSHVVRPRPARHRAMGLSGVLVLATVRGMDGPEGVGLWGSEDMD